MRPGAIISYSVPPPTILNLQIVLLVIKQTSLYTKLENDGDFSSARQPATVKVASIMSYASKKNLYYLAPSE